MTCLENTVENFEGRLTEAVDREQHRLRLCPQQSLVLWSFLQRACRTSERMGHEEVLQSSRRHSDGDQPLPNGYDGLAVSPGVMSDIEGRRDKIVEVLKQKRECTYYRAERLRGTCRLTQEIIYELTDEAKETGSGCGVRGCQDTHHTRGASSSIYGMLYEIVCVLPAKPEVDLEKVLRKYLGRYIYDLQACIVTNSAWSLTDVQQYMKVAQPSMQGVFDVTALQRGRTVRLNFLQRSRLWEC